MDLENKKKTNGSSVKERFTKISKIGEGSYGEVYKCKDTKSGKIVALKKIKLENEDEGIPSTTLREIAILQKLKNKYLVELLEISYSYAEKKLFLIFEYIEQDFKNFIDKKLNSNNIEEVKKIFYQILLGIDFIHSQGVLHRDMKPQNILINSENIIKIADFGLSRCISLPLGVYTKEIETLWYRAPELVLGDEIYSVNVDMWSVGCIFAEMILKKPIFKGISQLDQIFKIFHVFGSPNEFTWPGISNLSFWKPTLPKFKGVGLKSQFPDGTDDKAIDLLSKLLTLCPLKRITARAALEHPFFDSIHKKNK